jgi:hypothetical protein
MPTELTPDAVAAMPEKIEWMAVNGVASLKPEDLLVVIDSFEKDARSDLPAVCRDWQRLHAELEAWQNYFGCTSPHDSHVGDGSALGKEQKRANLAENRIAALEADNRTLRLRVAELEAAGRRGAGMNKNNAFPSKDAEAAYWFDKAMANYRGWCWSWMWSAIFAGTTMMAAAWIVLREVVR